MMSGSPKTMSQRGKNDSGFRIKSESWCLCYRKSSVSVCAPTTTLLSVVWVAKRTRIYEPPALVNALLSFYFWDASESRRKFVYSLTNEEKKRRYRVDFTARFVLSSSSCTVPAKLVSPTQLKLLPYDEARRARRGNYISRTKLM